MSYKVLVVDSEPAVRGYAMDLLSSEGYLCQSADDVKAVAKLITENDYDVVLLDVAMLDKPNFELLEQIKRRDKDTIVVMLSSYSNIANATDAVKKGAYDYIIKPFNKDRLLLVLQKAIQFRFLIREHHLCKNDEEPYLIGISECIHHIRNIIKGIARSDIPVLLTGATGSGKEYTAWVIHQKSRRRGAPFIKVDCSVLPAEYIKNELFGSDKNTSPRVVGALEAANGGTLFLKNIDSLTIATQKKLLEVMKDKKLFYDGESSPAEINVRVIASSRINIEQYTKQKHFCKELYYYLNAIPIQLPPLSQRKNDIPVLAYHFLRSFAAKSGKHFIVTFHPAAMQKLQRHFYRCNIRELKAMVEGAVALCESREIMPGHITRMPCRNGNPKSRQFITITISEEDNLHNIEREIILSLLDKYNGSRKKVARKLGINPRTVRNKLNIYSKEGIKIIPSSRTKKES